MPTQLTPMLAHSHCDADRLQDYVFEFKWDGFRALLFRESASVRLQSRNRLDLTKRFPQLLLGDKLPTKDLVLDGEIVAFDADGRPSFALLQRYSGAAPAGRLEGRLVYVAFDLIYCDGSLITELPYRKRRELLEQVIASSAQLQVPPYAEVDFQIAAAAAKELRLEGVVAKRLHSPYRAGERSKDWCKFRFHHRQEFVVGGWTGRKDSPGTPGALLIGYYRADTDKFPPPLKFAGNVGSGFSDRSLDQLGELLGPLGRSRCPFANQINRRDAHFVEPKIVVEVQFSSVTDDGLLRQPVFKGIRFDKEALDVVAEW